MQKLYAAGARPIPSFKYLALPEYYFGSDEQEIRLRDEICPLHCARLQSRPPEKNGLAGLFFDLQRPGSAPIYALGIAESIQEILSNSSNTISFQSNTPSYMRRLLARESGRHSDGSQDPCSIPETCRSKNVHYFLELVQQWDDLRDYNKARVAQCLNKLGFYTFNFKFLDNRRINSLKSRQLRAELSSIRAVAAFKCGFPLRVVEAGLHQAVADSADLPTSRAANEIYLAVHHAKVSRNRLELEHWATSAKDSYIKHLDEMERDDPLFRSIFFRGYAYVPYMNGDMKRAGDILDEAESAALEALAAANINKLAARENLFAVTETRIQEARGRRQTGIAIERASLLVEIDPIDPRAHLHLGEALLEDGQVEVALASFRDAADLGAPYSPRALSMMGHCSERMGEKDEALKCYVSALDLEPCAVMTLYRAYALSAGNYPELQQWAAERLNVLRRHMKSGVQSNAG